MGIMNPPATYRPGHILAERTKGPVRWQTTSTDSTSTRARLCEYLRLADGAGDRPKSATRDPAPDPIIEGVAWATPPPICGEKPPPLHLIRRRVDLAVFDRRGRPLDSCIIEPDRRTHQDIEAERVATLDAQFAETDRRVLQAMRDYPAATNITRLRPYVGLRTGIVTDAVARLLRAGHVTEGRRGEPYTVTPSGLALLAGSTP